MSPFRTSDPLDDDPLLAGPARKRGAAPDSCIANGKCDGSGWVQVKPAYATNLHPSPDPLPLNATPAEAAAHELATRTAETLRVSAADSWYPCRDCLPDVFARWVGGHFRADHNRSRCEDCRGKRAS